jgi:Isocitrate/isopropylmalate dehydrogenase
MPHVVLLGGDGIGPEIIAQAERVLDHVNTAFSL